MFFFLFKDYFNCKCCLDRIQFYYISYIFKSFLLVYVKLIKSYINRIDVRYPISEEVQRGLFATSHIQNMKNTQSLAKHLNTMKVMKSSFRKNRKFKR